MWYEEYENGFVIRGLSEDEVQECHRLADYFNFFNGMDDDQEEPGKAELEVDFIPSHVYQDAKAVFTYMVENDLTADDLEVKTRADAVKEHYTLVDCQALNPY